MNRIVGHPLVSIWTRPRATIRSIVGTDPTRYVLVLAALAGVRQALNEMTISQLGDEFGPAGLIILALGAGAVAGMVGLYLAAWLFEVTGRWLGGTARARELRAALAWGGVPLVAALLVVALEVLLYGQAIFTSALPSLNQKPVFLALRVVESVLSIWALVLLLKCVSEVQGFSIWKALVNTVLATLAIVLPIALLVLVLGR